MRSGIRHVLYTAMTAGTALLTLLLTLSLAGTVTPAAAAPRSTRSPVYSFWASGYQAQGRWFRWATTTLTVAPRKVPSPDQGGSGGAVLSLVYKSL